MVGPTDELPISLECGDPVVESFVHTRHEVRFSRRHCVDKMGPDANGFYEFYYESDVYEFTQGQEKRSAGSATRSAALEADPGSASPSG